MSPSSLLLLERSLDNYLNGCRLVFLILMIFRQVALNLANLQKPKATKQLLPHGVKKGLL